MQNPFNTAIIGAVLFIIVVLVALSIPRCADGMPIAPEVAVGEPQLVIIVDGPQAESPHCQELSAHIQTMMKVLTDATIGFRFYVDPRTDSLLVEMAAAQEILIEGLNEIAKLAQLARAEGCVEVVVAE